MALKFGRTAGITSRIDPKTGTTMYTEDEYDAYESAVEAEKLRKSDYDASVKKYDTAFANYYGKSTVDKKAAAGLAGQLNKSGIKGSKGENISFTGSDEITQAEADKQFDEKVKKGEIISINDPSVTPRTRELLKGAYRRSDISKGFVNTGANFNDYGQIYGEDYNPDQFFKDAKAGKLDKYKEGHLYAPVDAASVYTRGTAPVAPGPYAPGPKIQKIDPKNVDWKERTLTPLKPTKIDQKPLGKLIPAKEDVTWNAPDLDKRKKASHMRGTKITPSRVTATGRRVDTKIGIHNAARRKQSDAVSPQRIKYNTEQRRSAAYYGDNTSTGEKITGKTESELRQLKKETRGEFGRVLKEGRLGDALTIGKDLSQIRRATRYTKDADLSVSSTGVTVEGEGSNLRYFTPERTRKVTQDGRQVRGEGAMAGYKEFQTQEKGKAFRAQYENATNRNNMSKKLADVATAAAKPTSSFSSSVVTRGQMKDKYKENNPTATPRQIRQGVRLEVDANKQLMKDVQETQKKTGMIKK